MSAKIPQHILDAAATTLRERADSIRACSERAVSKFSCDAQAAPIWADQLIHTFSKIERKIYPDLVACNGGVLPIDRSVSPAKRTWTYYMVDSGGFYGWIDDDGDIMHSAFVTAEAFEGRHAEHGGGYHYTIFDLETFADAGMVSLPTELAAADKRACDEHTEWVWMCGDGGKDLPGLLTHPNIPKPLARQNAGNTSRLFVNKTDDEILRDFVDLIDSIPQASLEAHHAAKVFMPFAFIREMRKRFVAATASGTISLWDKLKALYSGDDSGQGKVTFAGLNMCEAARRLNPATGTDTSGISGDVMLALPADDVDALCFIESRGYTQLPPQEENFKIKVLTHAKIGGVKCVRPLSAAMMVFGTV